MEGCALHKNPNPALVSPDGHTGAAEIETSPSERIAIMVSVDYTELSWPELRRAAEADTMVIVPVGATEQHGHHLPIQVDWRLVHTIAESAARAATERGRRVLVTPPIWTGFSPHHMQFPGSVTLRMTTFLALIGDLVQSLHQHGFRRILLLNGHGGNAHLLRALVQELRFTHAIRVAAASYWDFAVADIQQWRQSVPGGINHACELETSLMLAVRPDLVDMSRARDATLPASSTYLSPDLAVGGAVTVARTFAELTRDGVIGAAALADRPRGQALIDVIVQRVSTFLDEFADWPWDEPDDRPVSAERAIDHA
jgi:creatinine amidohydrolase